MEPSGNGCAGFATILAADQLDRHVRLRIQHGGRKLRLGQSIRISGRTHAGRFARIGNRVFQRAGRGRAHGVVGFRPLLRQHRDGDVVVESLGCHRLQFRDAFTRRVFDKVHPANDRVAHRGTRRTDGDHAQRVVLRIHDDQLTGLIPRNPDGRIEARQRDRAVDQALNSRRSRVGLHGPGTHHRVGINPAQGVIAGVAHQQSGGAAKPEQTARVIEARHAGEERVIGTADARGAADDPARVEDANAVEIRKRLDRVIPRIRHPEVAVVAQYEPGRFAQSAGWSDVGRHDVIRIHLADGIILRVRDENVTGGIHRQTAGETELRTGARAVSHARRTGIPGQRGHCAKEAHETERVVRGVRDDQTAAGLDDPIGG